MEPPDRIQQPKLISGHREDRNRVAPGIHGKRQPRILAQHGRALRTQGISSGSDAVAAGGEAACKRQRT
jgi:hypothetical protein